MNGQLNQYATRYLCFNYSKMASAFGHALASVALGTGFSTTIKSWKFWLLGMACSILPDADVITYQFGFEYGSFWGHRGFSHSFLFAVILGVFITLLFYRKQKLGWQWIGLTAFFTLSTASHSILDAMTSGGLGVAFFSPWDNTRYFFSWRPIQVSPIGIENFFSEWGKRVLLSELIWIGIPSVIYIGITYALKKIKK